MGARSTLALCAALLPPAAAALATIKLSEGIPVSSMHGSLAAALATLACTAQPKEHQVLGYSLAPWKHWACCGQPA